MMNVTSAPPILERLSALGDETRVRILVLLERSELTVTELAFVLQAPQPSVSRHLKTLAGEGWVEARVEGRNRMDDQTTLVIEWTFAPSVGLVRIATLAERRGQRLPQTQLELSQYKLQAQ